MRQLLLLALGVCLASAAADAQEGGGIVVFGGGTGSATIMCRACTHAGNMGGSTLSMQFGEQVSQHLRVAGTADWWWHERDTWMRGIWDVTAAVFYYPGTLRRGFYVEGGPTYSMILASATTAPHCSATAGGSPRESATTSVRDRRCRSLHICGTRTPGSGTSTIRSVAASRLRAAGNTSSCLADWVSRCTCAGEQR